MQTPESGGGSRERPALERCLDIPTARFAAEHWGIRPLLSHTGGFADLLDVAAVDEIVTSRGLRTPFLRLARDGKVTDPATYTSSGGVGARIADQADPVAIAALLAEGTTLVLQALHRIWPPIGRFARDLTDDLGHPVQVNAYITPPSAQGFASHYDTHDVFVLQVVGRKAWTLHEPVYPHPLPDHPWEQRSAEIADQVAGQPFVTTELVPGDSLYLPRGWLHSAATQDEISIHLTVGVHPLGAADACRALVDRAIAANPSLRTNLPLDAGTTDLATAVADVAQDLAAALGSVSPADAATDVVDRFDRDRSPAPVLPLQQLTAVGELTPHTHVRLRHGLRPRQESRSGRTRVTAAGRYVEAPEGAAAALAQLCSGVTTCAAELTGVNAETAMAIVRRALREGIVVVDDR